MADKAIQIVRRLVKIQDRLRRELFEKLENESDNLELIFDPFSFAPEAQELRDKHLSNIMLLQGLIQQVAQLKRYREKSHTMVARVSAPTQERLVKLLNEKLANLNGGKVLDVNFLPRDEEEDWTAAITYVSNPFTAQQDETGALM